jgi:hypothetical protein
MEAVRAWYQSSGCELMKRGLCVELDQWFCGSGSRSVRSTRTLVLW